MGIYRSDRETTSYNVQDIPRSLYKLIKSEAAKAEMTINEYIISVLTEEVLGDKKE